MMEYIRPVIKYADPKNGITKLGELSVATWGEIEELAKELARHYKLPEGEYDLYVMGDPRSSLKDLSPESIEAILIVPRYSGPLIKE